MELIQIRSWGDASSSASASGDGVHVVSTGGRYVAGREEEAMLGGVVGLSDGGVLGASGGRVALGLHGGGGRGGGSGVAVDGAATSGAAKRGGGGGGWCGTAWRRVERTRLGIFPFV